MKKEVKQPPAIKQGSLHLRDGRGFMAIPGNGGRVRRIPPVD